MSNYTTRTTKLTINLTSDPKIFAENATHVEIDDEAAGEFVTVKQDRDGLEAGEIAIEPEEWPALRAAIDQMVKECR